ncbi:MAG: AzlD domain-containing protein [Actinomycetota bacterium]
MSELWMILLMAAITFGSRASFMLRKVSSDRVKHSRFLDVFPIALFVALAARDLIAPAGEPAMNPSVIAGIGGVLGGLVFRRSLVATVVIGLACYWIARLAL